MSAGHAHGILTGLVGPASVERFAEDQAVARKRAASLAVAGFTREYADFLRDLAANKLTPDQLKAATEAFEDMEDLMKALRAMGVSEDMPLAR